MPAATRLDVFRQHNPFTSSSVGDPWEATYSDVPSINEAAFRGLCQLIAHKTAQPALNCAGLILGEVGSGKTHLISRILAQSKQAPRPFAFAYIQPLEDPEQAYRYLLREVIVNLCQATEPTSPATQLRRLVTRVFREGVQNASQQAMLVVSREQFATMQHRAIQRLSTAHPGIDTRFVKVLLDYAAVEKRPVALQWLKGVVLDAAEARTLQVPDRVQASAAALEAEAREMLSSLGLLLARYHQPLVLCFDRLENLETDAQTHALGKMLEFLVDKARAMLPMVCFRGLQWEDKFRHKFNQHVSSRLETNTFELRGCTAEQALAIVQSRLACVPGYQPEDGLFPFDREELLKTFYAGFYSPRRVITLANQRLRRLLDDEPSLIVSPLAKLQEEFDRHNQAILHDFERYEPDRGRLRRALELYLHHGPLEVTPPASPPEKYIDLVSTLRLPETTPARVIFLIDVESHHTAVGASLSRGIAFLQEDPSGKAVFIRDARCPFPLPPAWQTTNEKLQTFTHLGGSVLFLDAEQAAGWYALALLSYAVKEQEITVMNADDPPRPILFEELAAFIQQELAGKKTHAFQALDATLATPRQSTSARR